MAFGAFRLGNLPLAFALRIFHATQKSPIRPFALDEPTVTTLWASLKLRSTAANQLLWACCVLERYLFAARAAGQQCVPTKVPMLARKIHPFVLGRLSQHAPATRATTTRRDTRFAKQDRFVFMVIHQFTSESRWLLPVCQNGD